MKPARWLAERPWTLALVTWVILAVPGFLVVQYNDARSDRFVECLTSWANETAARTSALTQANDDVRKANDALLRAAANGNRAGIVAGLADYVRASDAYEVVRREHPVPERPELRCDR